MTETARLIIGPFNRVEGDLEVTLEIREGQVAEARVSAPLYRGFEGILRGRPASDALVIAPRICGICSVSQSVAAARALARIAGVEPPPNGRRAADLILACENAADHLTHFILFFTPDFARACYSDRPWFEAVHRRFAAGRGETARALLPARARFLHLMGILAGKWPHSLAIQPGGVTKAVDTAERMRLVAILADFRRSLEEVLFAGTLEEFIGISGLEGLNAWIDAQPATVGDARLFLSVARDLELDALGLGPPLLMSSGSFDLFPPGVTREGLLHPGLPETGAITEDSSFAWMEGGSFTPFAGLTQPQPDKPEAYTWCKAPRLGSDPVEVGALARQLADRHPLAVSLAGPEGRGSVTARVVARLLELARLVQAMEEWAGQLRPGEAICTAIPEQSLDGQAVGMVEAARGTLGHWVTVRDGRLTGYQIIAPTTWNFSPRDAQGRPGPLEQALSGVPILPGETSPVAVQHVVRSFDPCMVCTVH